MNIVKAAVDAAEQESTGSPGDPYELRVCMVSGQRFTGPVIEVKENMVTLVVKEDEKRSVGPLFINIDHIVSAQIFWD